MAWTARRLIFNSFFQAVFFNNYLMDPKRPQLPDHPANKNPPVAAPRPQFDMPPPQPYHPPPYQGGYQGGYQGNYGGGFRGGYYGKERPMDFFKWLSNSQILLVHPGQNVVRW